jgi:hypothetical protein
MKPLIIALALVACRKGNSELEAKYKQARDSIATGDKWFAATQQLEQMLGPAQVKDALEWRWAKVDGSYCYDVRIMKWDNVDKVRGVMGGVVNDSVKDRFDRCAKAANGEK